jgi:glycosyltransferase
MVSIITTSYNSKSTIADTLDSVKKQSYPDIEHIIIDGLSTDGTQDLVRGYPHVASLISEKDHGIYDAMNKGIQAAKGDIIGILNSDDFYPSPLVIEKVVSMFEQTGCDAVYGDLVYVNRLDTQKVVRFWRSGAYKNGMFKWGWMPPHPTFFVKREIYQQYGMFNLDLKTAADYELMLRFIHKHGIRLGYLREILVKMRDGGASNESLLRRLSANQADRKAWEYNEMKPYWFTFYLKPLRKLGQFLPWPINN